MAYSKPTIMVVDDDATVRALLCDLLEDAGYHVLAMKSGVNALQALDTFTPALLTLDMEMPGMSGGQVLMALQQRLGKLAPAVIIISAQEILPHFVRYMAQAVIAKPFEIGTLLGVVERLLPAATLSKLRPHAPH